MEGALSCVNYFDSMISFFKEEVERMTMVRYRVWPARQVESIMD